MTIKIQIFFTSQPTELQEHVLSESNVAPARVMTADENIADHTQTQHEQTVHTSNDDPNVQAVDPVNVFKHPTAKPQQLTRTQPTTGHTQDPFALTQTEPKNIIVIPLKQQNLIPHKLDLYKLKLSLHLSRHPLLKDRKTD